MSGQPAPTKPATLDDILAEVHAIRLILASRPTPPPQQPTQRAASSPPSGTGGQFADEPIPQPTSAWGLHEAECHAVHFGKNNGVALRDLADRSLSFYAKDQPPRLDSKGKPYPPRPADVDLRNAARTVWHHRRGTLAAGTQQPAPASNQPTAAAAPGDDEDVPF